MNYYVKNGGNNGLDGLSDANAWETITYVNSINFANSDTINLKRGSTFTDSTLTLNATSVGRTGITVQDYGTGDKPRIDGNYVQPIVINQALVNLTVKNIDVSGWNYGPSYVYRNRATFSSINGIVIDGVDFDGYDGVNTFAGVKTETYTCEFPYPSAGWAHCVIEVANCENGDVTVKNCTISNLVKETGFIDSFNAWCKNDLKGILLYPTDYEIVGKTSGTVDIHDNVISNVYSDSIQIKGIQVEHYIHDNVCVGFGENFFDSKTSRAGRVYNNIITGDNIGKDPGNGWFGPGGMVFHTAPDMESTLPVDDQWIYNNYISDIYGEGMYLGADTKVYNNYIKDVLLGIRCEKSGCEIYNNIIETTSNVEQDPDGHYVGRFRTGILLTGNTSDSSKIYNNTIVISNNLDEYGISIENIGSGAANVIKNNIIQVSKDSAVVFPIYWDGTGTEPETSNNVSHSVARTNRISWNGVTYTASDQAAWIAAGHPNEQFTDPLLVNVATGDLTLQSESPAINAGANLGVDYDDALNPSSTWPDGVTTVDQDDYGTGWDIGAFVYTGVPPTPYTRMRGINRPKTIYGKVGRQFRR